MKPAWLPTGPEVLREAIILLAGAVLATLVVKSLPDQYRGLFSFTGSNQP